MVKTMDYEKAYKDALSRASKLGVQNPFDTVSQMMEHVFPELAESDVEKNIKDLIDELKCSLKAANCQNDACGGGHEKRIALLEWAIAWLEKQGESIKIKKGKNYLCTKTHKYAGVEWIEGVKYYSPEDYSLVNQGCTCYCPKYSKEEHNNFFKEVEYNGWLEKQGEQKSTLPKWKYKKDNTPLLRDSIILNKYGGIAKSPSGAIVSDVWVLDYDELAKLPKEKIEKQVPQEQDGFDAELNALLKKYEHLSKKELQEPLEFYLEVVRDDLDVVREEEKPKWTEEDEKCIDNCCLLIGAADDCYEKPFKYDCIHYLQSLKERIAPKRKWTEEDNKILMHIIQDVELLFDDEDERFKDERKQSLVWLKSLKQRMEEQQ